MGEDGRTSSIHQKIKLLDKGVVQRGSGEPAPTLEWSKVVEDLSSTNLVVSGGVLSLRNAAVSNHGTCMYRGDIS